MVAFVRDCVWSIGFLFYVFLKLLFHWPTSIMTCDILFLIPVPWAAHDGDRVDDDYWRTSHRLRDRRKWSPCADALEHRHLT